MAQNPLGNDDDRMRRYIASLRMESDYDSEYANHPPPTDSEIDDLITIQGSRVRRNEHEGIVADVNMLDPTPEYVTEEENHTVNRLFRNGRISSGGTRNSMTSLNNAGMNRVNSSLINSVSVSLNNSSTNLVNQPTNLLYGLSSNAMGEIYKQKKKLKDYGLKRLSVKQHIVVTICRDIPIYFMLKNYAVLIMQWYRLMKRPYSNVITVRATEFFLASLWCLVSALISYTILDGFMVRWMVMYDIQAAIVRILSSSLMIILTVEMFNYTFNNANNEFCLTAWILISCVLTVVFIIQCFLSNPLILEEKLTNTEIGSFAVIRRRSGTGSSSNGTFDCINHARSGSLNSAININNVVENFEAQRNRGNSGITVSTKLSLKNKLKRKVDLYNLVVFAVVPIGVASFVSVIGLVRLLLILRLDVGMEITRIQQGV